MPLVDGAYVGAACVGARAALGLFQVTMYGVGLVLGPGIYVLIGQAAATREDLVWASFLLAAGISVFTGLSYAELAASRILFVSVDHLLKAGG